MIEDPDQLSSARDINADEFLYFKAKGMFLSQRCNIIEPVKIGPGDKFWLR